VNEESPSDTLQSDGDGQDFTDKHTQSQGRK